MERLSLDPAEGRSAAAALQAPLQKTDTAFAAALEKFFKDGSGNFAGAKHGKVTWFTNGTGQIHWNDASQKQVAWGSIFLQDPNTPVYSATKIDGTYPVLSSSSKNIWLSLGCFKRSL
jgi:hypothetical protein